MSSVVTGDPLPDRPLTYPNVDVSHLILFQCSEPHGLATAHHDATEEDELSYQVSYTCSDSYSMYACSWCMNFLWFW